MYKLIMPLLILLLACSITKSKEETAKERVRTELKETMHDFSSYQPVKWGKLDSTFSHPKDLPEWQTVDKAINEAQKETKHYLNLAQIYSESQYLTDEANKYLKEAKFYQAQWKKALDDMQKLTKTLQPKFKGYSIEHSYRGKNMEGHLRIGHYRFYLDSSMNVIGSIDIGENAKTID